MDLYQYLQSARKSLFRFETLQEYNVGDDGLDDQGMKDWWDFITLKTSAGVKMERVRLTIEPFTEYTKKELLVHAKSKTFGDDIRTIDEATFKRLSIKQEDFWLIDDNIVLSMKYSDSGVYLGFDIIETEIQKYVETKNTLNELPRPEGTGYHLFV